MSLIDDAPQKIDQLQALFKSIKEIPILSRILDLENLFLDNINEMIRGLIQTAIVTATSSIALVIDYTTSILITIIVVPFLLYYMLNEQGKGSIPVLVDKIVPQRYAKSAKKALSETDKQLASYVQGLCIVCFIVDILSYIDFIIIGIIDSPLMILKAILVILVIQQIDSLVVRPQIVGRKMAMSPLAVIIVVLQVGRLWGLTGIILAVPIFTVIKITVGLIYEFVWYNTNNKEEEKNS